MAKLKTAIQKFVVPDQPKKFQSVIPAQAGIYGSQLEFTPYMIRGWDESLGLRP
jgi:hypothetical protein